MKLFIIIVLMIVLSAPLIALFCVAAWMAKGEADVNGSPEEDATHPGWRGEDAP